MCANRLNWVAKVGISHRNGGECIERGFWEGVSRRRVALRRRRNLVKFGEIWGRRRNDRIRMQFRAIRPREQGLK
jgi:hypothetical protein